ncbi:hypothetical protein ACFYO1_04610 [Nocardia sp. NPDC006044]|uniref:hypothetical protein n=1 Tax=Nocardia sp. NPDC006044 TaxID=3364306 RepID=UPI0036ACA7E8
MAFVVAPRLLAGRGPGGGFADEGDLRAALRVAFVEYWGAGARDFPPSLARVVDYWFRYHVAKAVIATILLVVLVALGIRLWRAFLRSAGPGAGRRVALGSAGGLATALALGSLVLVMANVQGAVAPFASLLPMLTTGPADGALSPALEQIRQQLADAGGRPSPILDVMIGDFARYHTAMAVIATIVAITLLALSVVSWRKFSRTESADQRPRRLFASLGTLATALTLATLVVAVANTGTAANPTPALAAFFAGGW